MTIGNFSFRLVDVKRALFDDTFRNVTLYFYDGNDSDVSCGTEKNYNIYKKKIQDHLNKEDK